MPGLADNSFERAGYIACQCVALTFALAMSQWVSAPLLEPGASLSRAILTAAAATLATIAAIFELRSLNDRKQWFDSSLPLLVGGLLAGLLFLWVMQARAVIAYAIIGATCMRLLVVAFRAGARAAPVPILAGAAIGYWAFLLSFVDGYKTLWISQAIQSGTVHVDLLFHSAIASMLSGYGVGSLGVDGLATFPYHFGSHRVMIVLYEALGIEPLQFYSVVFPLVFGPLFVCLMYLFANAFRVFLIRTDAAWNRWRTTGAGWFWAVFAIFFVGVISAAARRQLGVWDNAFHSESFGVAILLAYFGGIWLFEQLGKHRQIRITWSTSPILALYLGALCVLKISVGLVIGCVFVYALLRSRVPRLRLLPGLLAVALPLLYGLWLTRSNTGSGEAGPGLLSMLKPFAFLRDIVKPEAYGYSFIAFFGPLITFVVLRLLSGPRNPVSGLRSRLESHTLLDVELAVVVTIASIMPGILLAVPQGSTNFFAEVSYWWVQPVVAVMLSLALARFTSREEETPRVPPSTQRDSTANSVDFEA